MATFEDYLGVLTAPGITGDTLRQGPGGHLLLGPSVTPASDDDILPERVVGTMYNSILLTAFLDPLSRVRGVLQDKAPRNWPHTEPAFTA
ncbi:hypothetical protein Dimus_037911 [Dionaea muscipula]